MPGHQKVQKRSQKIQSIQDKRRNLQKDSTPAEEEERLLFLSNKVDKNKMADAEMAAELQSLQAGEETRGSNASQTCDCCMEALWQQFIALGVNRIEVFVQRLQREMGTAQGQMPGREEGTRKSEDEQEQDKASQQLALSEAGAVKAPQRAVWSLSFLGFGVRLVNVEEQGSHVQQRLSEKDFCQTPQVDVPWRKKMLHCGLVKWERLRELVVKKIINEKRNSQGRGPKNL